MRFLCFKRELWIIYQKFALKNQIKWRLYVIKKVILVGLMFVVFFGWKDIVSADSVTEENAVISEVKELDKAVNTISKQYPQKILIRKILFNQTVQKNQKKFQQSLKIAVKQNLQLMRTLYKPELLEVKQSLNGLRLVAME